MTRPPPVATPPPRFRVHEEPGVWSVEWPWRTREAIISLLLVLVLLVVFNVDETNGWRQSSPLMLAVRVLFHLCMLYLGWLYLARVVNRTRLTVTRDTVAVKHGPLPQPQQRNQQWEPAVLKQVRADRDRGGRGHALYAPLPGTGVEQKLVGELPDAKEAEWLASQLQQHLERDGAAPPSGP